MVQLQINFFTMKTERTPTAFELLEAPEYSIIDNRIKKASKNKDAVLSNISFEVFKSLSFINSFDYE